MTAHPRDAQRGFDPRAVQHALRRAAKARRAPFLYAEVAQRMAQRLAPIRLQPESLIDWWSFTGAGAALLEAAYPRAQRLLVEPTPELLARSRAEGDSPWWSPRRWRAPRSQRSQYRLEADVEPGAVQLVWANMMLHAMPEPPLLFSRWHSLLQTDGFVMFSCLGPGTLIELRRLYAQLGWPSPAAEFVDMHDLGDMLVHAGFADPVLDQETLTLHWADPAALLRELRSLGGNADPKRHAGLRTPRWRDRLVRELAGLAGPDGRVRLSFEVAYGHAFKPKPRLRSGEPMTVSLQEMRAMVRRRDAPARQ